MSAIAGIHRFGVLPPETPEILSRMSSALASIGPDGGAVEYREDVAMAHRAFHVTRESRFARQPYVSPDGLLVSWDGRLDNRDELSRQLGLASLAERTDVELVARTYRSLGSELFSHLVGDFALALWDASTQRLILARDAFGGRPLFYRRDGDRMVWASTLSALLASQVFAAEIDDEWLTCHLIREACPERTPYRGVRPVPPGQLVIVEGHRLNTRRFWNPGGDREIRYGDDAEYEEHFRELFFDAVRCRLHSGGTPVCAELSGGLDSSSVACVADCLLRSETSEASDLFTYSFVYDQASSSDEREFIRPVEQRLARQSFHILEDEHPLLADLAHPTTEVPHFFQTSGALYRHGAELMRRHGARVLLTGFGGDQLMWSEVPLPFHLADLAARGRFASLFRELRRWHHRGTRFPEPYPQLVWHGVLRPLGAMMRGRSLGGFARHCFPWLSDRLRQESRRHRQQSLPRSRGFRGLPSRLACIADLDFLVAHLVWSYHYAELGVEVTHPFLHRPLVDFCLAIPIDQFVRPHETRSLHRRALRDVLPHETVNRTTKSGPDEAMVRALRREWPTIRALLTDARVCERGYADRERLAASLERASFGLGAGGLDLLRLLEVEVWLRAQERPGMALAA